MASCWALTGLVLVALAFIASAISLVAPYWYENAIKTESTGLWADCGAGISNIWSNDGDKCVWFFQNDFAWEKNLPDWYKAVQGLFVLGVLGILFAFLIACFNLCCGCCRSSYSVLHIINGLLVLAFLEVAVSIAVFGAKAHEERGVSINTRIGREFSWAFWIGAAGAGLDLLAIIFYSIEGCRSDRTTREEVRYTRADVV